MMNKLILIIIVLLPLSVYGIEVDFSVAEVPEERGLNLMCITQPNDNVAMPQVIRKRGNINWLSNRIINISPSGDKLAFISVRDAKTNIFSKDLNHPHGSVQRTNRSNIIDFSFSPDGDMICFSEDRGNGHQVFMTDSNTGFVCQQLTSGGDDYSPILSIDGKSVLFARNERQGTCVWSYNIANQMLTSYTMGLNPYPLHTADVDNGFICTRINGNAMGEIWMVDIEKGTEKCILSDDDHSFTTPMLSPDGKWIVCVGSSKVPTDNKGNFYLNTDIFVVSIDGSALRQLTFHAADELSPIWSNDGRYIYFVSQRGNADAKANIWRIDFNEKL